MRRSTARRAVVIGAATMLALTSAGMVAAADPATPTPTVPALPADLVAAVQRDLHLSADQYLERADLAQRLAAFATTLREQYRDAFAGTWLDENGRGIVALATSPAFDDARKAVTDAGFETKEVARSEPELANLATQFDEWLATQPADVSRVVRGVAIDTVANTVAVRIEGIAGLPLPSFLNVVRTVAMPAVASAEPVPVTTVAGDYSRTDLAGGDAYAASNTNGSLRCSLGFNAVDAAGAVVNVSAGHCDPDLASAGTPNAS